MPALGRAVGSEEIIPLDVLLGFLIGLVFPPMLVIVIASLITARSGFPVIAGVAGLIMTAGPVVWIMTFIALGFLAGLAAFAGWVMGLGLAGLMIALFVASRARRLGSGPPSAVRS